MTTTPITADSFPTPDLALRSTDPAELERVRAFAERQADAAGRLRTLLEPWLGLAERWDRVRLLRGVHAAAVRWRYELALRAPGRLGVGIPLDAERFRTSLRDGGANMDRLGYLGRLRAGAEWDPTSRTYVGGASTPAHEVMLAYGQAAQDRFTAEGMWRDILVNVVELPGGRPVKGNRLVRGAEAARVAAELTGRIAARGGDASRVETGGDPVYAVTADPDDADVLFHVALSVLADAHLLDRWERLRTWQQARYLLYQAPRTKKGSDAVTRVFLVAVGAVLFGRAPVLEHDVDLRCMVLGQAAATEMPADTALL
ncbi:MAG TPA: hypothetical protein VGL02_06700, partial [Streptomyces sp.]